MLDQLAQQRATRLQVAKLNTDEQPDIAGRFNIRSIPTLILFRDGREIARQSGAVNGGALERWLDTALAPKLTGAAAPTRCAQAPSCPELHGLGVRWQRFVPGP